MREWRYNHAFLIPARGGGEWSALHPGRFTPRKQLLVRNEYQAGRPPKDGVDTLVKRKKISRPGQEMSFTVLERTTNYMD